MVCKSVEQEHGLEKALDNQLIEQCRPALERREKVALDLGIRNLNRTVGAMLAGEVARRHGKDGLPPGTIKLVLQGFRWPELRRLRHGRHGAVARGRRQRLHR